jgi:hypothetical protein
MTRTIISTAVAFAMIATGASAAHLDGQQGTILINNRPVAADSELAPGDRISVMSGTARVVYDNGISQDIGEGQTAVVLANAPGSYPPGGRGGRAPGADPYDTEDNSSDALVIGGVVLLGTGLAIALSHQHSAPNPLSP